MGIQYRIEGVLNPGDPDGSSTPRSGQIVEFKKHALIDAALPSQVAYEICRPDTQRNNRVWRDSDFERCVLFRPRWSGYDALDTLPLECHGYLVLLRPGFFDRDSNQFVHFTPGFECVAHPVNEDD